MKISLILMFILLSLLCLSQDNSPRIFIPKSDNLSVKEETKYIHLEHPWSISFILNENEEVYDLKVINGKIDTIYEYSQEYFVLRAKTAGKVIVDVTFKKLYNNQRPKYFKEKQVVQALVDPGQFELELLEDNLCENKTIRLYAKNVKTKKKLTNDFYPPQSIGNSLVKIYENKNLLGETKIKEDLLIDLSEILKDSNINSDIEIIAEPLLVSRKYGIISSFPVKPFKMTFNCNNN
ncbi:MAG: hypothetical protein H6586_02380 [Flavobacteriales bacterium]|nr:hypothetical protein [Flavobacteriales bacterium]